MVKQKGEGVNCKLYLDVIVLEGAMKGGSFAFQDVDLAGFLEIREDVSDLALVEICVHSNFFTRYCCVEMDNDPLNSFRDGLPSRHGGGKR